jgi:hypothetical protein
VPELTLYIAGKVSKESHFGTHHWRDNFVAELSRKSGLALTHLDPLKYETGMYDPQMIFDKDCWLIDQVDCVIVYLSDDISVGGSQEMLIAKYLGKPLIGLAPIGGKFNQKNKEFMGQVINDYVDPFVFATCDAVCDDVQSVADTLRRLADIRPKTIRMIDTSIKRAALNMQGVQL